MASVRIGSSAASSRLLIPAASPAEVPARSRKARSAATEVILSRYRQALSAWERYLRRNPNDFYIFTRIGDVQKKQGHFREAEQAYLRALDLHPDDPYALMGMADLCYKMNRDEEALAFWRRLGLAR